MSKLLILVFTVFMSAIANATDVGKEQRWAEQVEANLFDGEMIYLEAEGHKFLGILMEVEGAKGAIVLAHGTGVHPDWEQVINPLRVGLAEQGWNTLSIQMPVLPNEVGHDEYAPVFPEAGPRLAAAADYFAGQSPVVLVAHSLGAAMSTWYMKHEPNPPYQGFVGIGMGGSAGQFKTYMEADNVSSLKSVNLPMMDLYGAEDFENVVGTASARAASQQHNTGFKQVVAADSNHFFDGQDDLLISLVSDWLEGLE